MRIFKFYAYICFMKNRLNITIDEALLEQAKRYAQKHNTSVSKLVESYFTGLARSPRKKNILDLIDDFPKTKRPAEDYVKENYYQSQKKKYGF